jgi:hypothetical protein
MAIRAQVAMHTPSEQEAAADRVELQQTSAAIGLAHRVRGRALWLRSALLAGISRWRVTALDLEGAPRETRLQPLVVVAVTGGVHLAGSVSVRLDLALAGYPAADRYLVQPEGVVARSPRAGLAVGMGVEWGPRD